MSEDKMPFTDHLAELRKRIIFALVSLFFFFAIFFYFSEHLFEIIIMPIKYKLLFQKTYPFVTLVPAGSKVETLIFLRPAEAFWMHIKVSIVAAFIFSLPVILYQVWQFISPGLFPNEKKYVGPFIIVASLLFVAGAAFCFMVVLPFALNFLLGYKMDKTLILEPKIAVGDYIDFCLKFILAFGLVFELPIVILFLTKMGIVSPGTLSKNRKYAVLISFILAAILTPTPDAFNQLLMAGPIMVLYEVGIIVSRIFSPKREENDG